MMIEFEDSVKLERFKNYAAKRRIKLHTTVDNDKMHLIVVDIAFEKEAYEFVNSN
jgi:hypothetical protein